MNRKRKLKCFYKLAATKNLSMREKLLGGLMAATLAGGTGYQLLNEKQVEPQINPDTIVSEDEAIPSIILVDYKIKEGDTIRGMAEKLFPGNAERAKKYIMDVNHLDDESVRRLRPGKIIKIPRSADDFSKFFNLDNNKIMLASDSLKAYIKDKEKMIQKKTKVESDSDIETIGYGHRLDTEAEKKECDNNIRLLKLSGRKDGLFNETDPVVMQWFIKDIKDAEQRVKYRALPALNQNQFDALVSFSFNTGRVPDISAELEAGDISAAANKIRNDASATKEGYGGLGGRRSEEASLFEKPM